MSDSNTIVVLFNYGGGMRGLIPAHFMARIEEKTGLHMTDMVDVFCGPSTGAILNAALNLPHPNDPTRPKWAARHLVKFYEREGLNIFPPDRFRSFRGLIHDFNNRTMKIGQLRRLFRHGHYDPRNLSEALDRLYGDAKLGQSLKSLIIPVYNLDGRQLEITTEADETEDMPAHTKNNFVDAGGYAVWLKNMHLSKNKRPPPNVLLRDAILASTAAPTYFPSHHFQVTYPDGRGQVSYSGIDGSIFDNPPISYYGALRQHLPEKTRVVVILLGTGHTLRSFKKEDWNRYGGLGIVDPVNDLPLINILFHASETALVEGFTQEVKDDLYVFNKSMIHAHDNPMTPNTAIDDASEVNLKKMKHFFEATLEENQKRFDTLCEFLVSNHENKKNQSGAVPFWKRWF